jgi:hypothetical protein
LRQSLPLSTPLYTFTAFELMDLPVRFPKREARQPSFTQADHRRATAWRRSIDVFHDGTAIALFSDADPAPTRSN